MYHASVDDNMLKLNIQTKYNMFSMFRLMHQNGQPKMFCVSFYTHDILGILGILKLKYCSANLNNTILHSMYNTLEGTAFKAHNCITTYS